MRHVPSGRGFELVARDVAVTAGSHRDSASAIKSRIGDALRRLYGPLDEAPLEECRNLLTLLDEGSTDGLK